MTHFYILGTRGIPAQHGGFETFTEKLALYLTAQGHSVTVYCQKDSGEREETVWQGIRLISIPVKGDGAFSTIKFDFLVTLDALKRKGLFLLLGYNTASFNILQRLFRQTLLINMDGIEWKRQKWGVIAKTWFWLNERFGCWLGNHLVADHPRIKDHLATRVSADKITMIPYGGDEVLAADASLLGQYGLTEGNYSIIIARPEPENSFLEMVQGFSSKRRDHKLVVLGKFDFQNNPYHQQVKNAASDEVIFPGAIYEAAKVQALRFYARFYLHGHRVGGTNPSLVEALGAGCAVIAHNNHFNRWVAGEEAAYFDDAKSCSNLLDTLLIDDERLSTMRASSRKTFNERFTWENILSQYEALLTKWYPKG